MTCREVFGVSETQPHDVAAPRSLPARYIYRFLAFWLALLILAIVLYSLGYTTQLHLFRNFATLRLWGEDSWLPMRSAYEWLTSQDTGAIYQDVFFDQKIKFQYPLTSLLVYWVADPLNLKSEVPYFNLVNWLSTLAQGLIAGLIANELISAHARATPAATRAMTAFAAGLLTVTFFPILWAFYVGQIQLWLNTFFLLACLFWLRGNLSLAGACLGAICMFKPQLGLFLIWAAMRGHWTFAKGFLLVTIPAALMSLLLFGISNNFDYYHVLRFISRHGEVFYANQSINGLLHRLIAEVDSRVWHDDAFAPYAAFVHYATMLSSLFLMAFGLFYDRRRDPRGWRGLLVAALAFTMASPVAWEHHFGFVVPMLLALAADAIVAPKSPARMRRLVGLAVCYALLSQDFFTLVKGVTPLNSLAYSYFFFAVCGLMLLLATMRQGFPAADVAKGFSLSGFRPRGLQDARP